MTSLNLARAIALLILSLALCTGLGVRAAAACNDPHSGMLPFDMNWCDREPDNGLRVNPRYEIGSNGNPLYHHCRDDTPFTLLTYSVPDSDSISATDWTALYTNYLTHGIDVDGQIGPFISHFVTYPIVMFKGGPLYFEAFGDDDDWRLAPSFSNPR
jgi:hypothetical protein